MVYSNEDFLFLLEYSFEEVYQAELDNELDYYSWEIIEPYTVRLNILQDWDKCKKMRKALVKKFVSLGVSDKYFYNITKNKKLIEELRHKYKKAIKK